MGFENYFLIFCFMVVANIVCASSALIIWRKNVTLNDKYDNALKMLCDEEDLSSSNAAIIKKLSAENDRLNDYLEKDVVGTLFKIVQHISNNSELEDAIDNLTSQLAESESKFIGLQTSFWIMEQQRNVQCEIVNRVHVLCNNIEAERGLMGWISVDTIRSCLNRSN